MKTKEIIALGAFAVVMAVVAILLLNNSSSGQAKTRSAQIEVVQPITAEYNDDARNILLQKDSSRPVEDFLPPVDVNQGLGNSAPFTQSN